MVGTIPEPFAGWFARRGWTPRPHQLAVLDAAQGGESVLLIAPTGGGKTLAGFLPSLIDLAAHPSEGIHTLYVSPLKALATDIARNLTAPVQEMDLPIRIETRTGDTPADRRKRQRERPPQILLTTPESLAILLSLPDGPDLFAGLRSVVIDEIHALAGTKRGDQLALGLARLATIAPGATRIGLSATVAHPAALTAYVSPNGDDTGVRRIEIADGAPPELGLMLPEGHLPWSGRMGLINAPQILARIRDARLTIVFVNTRAQGELIFQELWKLNDDTLPIALHHGSLDIAQRRRVEAAMARGDLRAVVATSSLDLGIDWGGVDQVIQVGAPKGVSRLLQRVGRANHRMDEASRAILVPANRFEVLECEAAILGVAAHELDGDPPRPGGLDVLAQHLLLMAAGAPFHPDDMFAEIRRAAPYANLPRRDFDDVLRFVEDGGYALAAYERYRKLFRDSEGRIHIRSERLARQARMNVGTIVEAPLLKVRYAGRGGHALGEVEEYFANLLSPGDTFMFAARLLRFIRIRETTVEVADGGTGEPMVPAYAGGRLPLTTNLAHRVRSMLHDPGTWHEFPEPVREWLRLQRHFSAMPSAGRSAGRNLPARRPLVSRRLHLRGPQRASDARHAAHPPHGAHGPCPARLRRHGLRHRRVVGERARPHRRIVRAGHAGRRSRSLDGGELHAPPHLPQRRGDRGPHRAPPSRRRQIETTGDREFRPHLCRAAQAPARPHPAARHARRCRRRAHRSRPASPPCSGASPAASGMCGSTASRRSPFLFSSISAARACAPRRTRTRCSPRRRRWSRRRRRRT